MNRKNRYYYYYRLIRWRLLNDRSPIAAAIKITQRCNLRCKHCTWQNKVVADLPYLRWKRIIDDLYDNEVTVIVVEGGEPLLHRDVARIVDYINSKNMYTIIVTNGTKDISGLNPSVFWISIDGMRDSNNKIRGRGVFEKILYTLRTNRDKRLISLTTITSTNVEDIEPMCKYFTEEALLDGLMFHFGYPYKDIKDEMLDADDR